MISEIRTLVLENTFRDIKLVENLIFSLKMQDDSKKHLKQSSIITRSAESTTSTVSDEEDNIHLPTGTRIESLINVLK